MIASFFLFFRIAFVFARLRIGRGLELGKDRHIKNAPGCGPRGFLGRHRQVSRDGVASLVPGNCRCANVAVVEVGKCADLKRFGDNFMADVAEHYEMLLARHYSWMVGTEFDAKVAEQQALLDELGVKGGGSAVDLGCGPGYQAVALAKLGFSPVTAVDGSQILLDELRARAKAPSIQPVRADIRDFKTFAAPDSASAIVCMGDTLTHLQSLEDVSQVLADAHRALKSGGLLALTFRDLSIERSGLDRFLPIRADADRIMTCVLEFETDHVVINDLIYVREGESWALNKSSYRKVRLGVDDVLADLRLLGFKVRVNRQLTNGMQAIAAMK